MSNAQGTWAYGSNADSDVDIGWDYSGNGGWVVSGSVHIGDGSGGEISGTTHNNYNTYTRTWFAYNLYQYRDKSGAHSGWCSYLGVAVDTEKKQATGWNGGIDDDPQFPIRGCLGYPYGGSYPPGTTVTKTATRSTKIGFAVGFPGGIQLGNQSGYSSYVHLTWHPDRSGGIILCGLNDYVFGTPGVIYASNKYT